MADKKKLSPAEKKEDNLNLVLSIFDPEIQHMAYKLAEMLGEDSILKSSVMCRLIGPATSWLESRSRTMGPIKGAVVEKATDFLDKFSAAIGIENERTKKEPKDKKEGASKSSSPQDIVKDIMKGAEKRFREAKGKAAKQEVLDDIKEEFNVMKDLAQHMKEQAAEIAKTEKEAEQNAAGAVKEATETKQKSFSETMQHMTGRARSFRERLEAKAAERKAREGR